MLYLIGTGLSTKQLTLEALHAAQTCSEVFLENYTNAFSQGDIYTLEKTLAKKITTLNRKGMEEDAQHILEKAKNHPIGILIIGNPLTATTHVSLLEECVKQKINYHIIPGISIFNSRGICGLDEYRFGRTTTLVFPYEGYEPLSTFDIIVKNKTMGLHTHCLFDLHPEKQRFMSIDEGITFIEHASSAREMNIHSWVGIGLSGMGNENQKVMSGKLVSLKKEKWEQFPQSLIICGDLTPYERDAMQKLGGLTW